jgi:hypothetical protein
MEAEVDVDLFSLHELKSGKWEITEKWQKKSMILHCFIKLGERNLLEAIKISRTKPVIF